jgi:superfamily II DNA or RNA helicase
MNNNLEVIYKIIKPGMNKFVAQPILGGNIALGIERYCTLQDELIGGDGVDYAELVVEALDKDLLTNDIFINSLILDLINENDVKGLAVLLKIPADLSAFKKRQSILGCGKNVVKKTLLTFYNLEKDYFVNPTPLKTITTECIIPFTPVPIEERNAKELIHKEYLALHDYQKNIKDNIVRNLLFGRKNAKMLVHMPTGSGKTKTAIEAILDFIRVSLRLAEDGGTIVWFAHSKELCEQAYQTFKSIWKYKGDYPINAYKYFGDTSADELSKCKEDKASIVFCGFQKFNSILSSKPAEAELFELKHFFHTNTKLVVVDEAHKSLATTYKKAIEFTNTMPNCRLLGLTATPGRSNYIEGDNQNDGLADFFGNNIISICHKDGSKMEDPLTYLQEKKVLAKIIFEELDFNLDLKKLGYDTKKISSFNKEKDLSDTELDLIATDPERNAIIISKIKECYNAQESTLVFACTKDHCIILQRLLKLYDIESVVILGETNKDIRSDAISRFKKNDLKILINYGVLSTGFDAPNLNSLIMARPTNSIVLYSQIVGRALRGKNNGGNDTNKIITIKDNMIGFPDPNFMFSYWNEFWN